MARNSRQKTHLENLAVIPRTAHGDTSGDVALAVFAVDSDDISGSPTAKFSVTDTGNVSVVGDLTVAGRQFRNMSYMDDDFYGIDTTDIVARTTGFKGIAPGTADTVTISVTADVPGAAKILSGTSDNDAAFLATDVSYYGKYNASFECRLTIDSASAVGLCIGFSDATGVGSNATPLKLIATTYTAVGNDGAMFLYDTDATTDTIRCHSVKNGTKSTAPIDTSLVPVATTYNVYRVDLVDNATTTTAYFYVDGTLVATIADALTRTVALTPFISVGTRTGAAPKYAIVDYVRVWQNRA
jgi:hypothetical protein